MAIYGVVPLQLSDDYRWRSARETPEVRLLILLPGDFEEPLQSILLQATLPGDYNSPNFHAFNSKETKSPPSSYEALSYAWGDSTKTYSIQIKPGIKIEDVDQLRAYLDNLIENGITESAWTQLKITKNLHIALQYMRLPVKPRVLWADAICIDQNNEKEKTQQVMIMDRIYAQADQVLVWLGEASQSQSFLKDSLVSSVRDMGLTDIETIEIEIDEDSSLADGVSRSWSKDDGDSSMDPDPDEPSESEFAIDLLEEARLGTLTKARRETGREAVQNLLRRPWWTRAWVVQEVIMARECTFMCGFRSISWDTMGRGISAFDPFPSDGVTEWSVKGSEFWPPMLWMLQKYLGMSLMMQLPYLLAHLCNRSCSDPRDKIFSVINLVAAGPRLRIDYAKSTREVYLEAVQQCVLHKPNLNIITRHHTGFDPTKVNELNLPSWVPDFSQSGGDGSLSWTVATDFYYRDLYFADGRFNLEGITQFQFLDPFLVPGMMLGQGFCLDCITSILGTSTYEATSTGEAINSTGDNDNSSCTTDESSHDYHHETRLYDDDPWAAFVRSWEPSSLSSDDKYAKTGESLLRAYWRTLVMDKYDHKWRYSNLSEKFAPWWRGDFCYQVWARHAQLSEYGSRLDQHVEKFAGMVRQATQGRRFALTEKGYMALVPEAALAGDLVVVLLGGSTPFVLRDQSPPEEDQHERFCMIGAAYVHGWMDGEIVERHKAGEVDLDYFRIH